MRTPKVGLPNRKTRSEWVRLRTLILLRWLAISGQLGAIIAADRFFDVRLDLGLCYAVVGVAIIANLVSIFVFPVNKRLTEFEAMLTLLFDLAQLGFLLYLTGGLHNPFALLILAPVTISASTLRLQTTVFLGMVAIAIVTLVSIVHLPLTTDAGEVLNVPPMFEFGFRLSIIVGIVFLGLYSFRVATEIHSMGDALLATQMALSREQKLTDLGGVVAAAAHELGTPLATIMMVSAELMDDLDGQPALREDAALIREQADRCRDILRSMGRTGRQDLLLRQAPITAIVREAAEPHQARGREIRFESARGVGGSPEEPGIRRQPEIVHGLRNLIQNAVDFAASTVWIDVAWTDRTLSVRIADDGAGFPPQVLGRIGDPFVRTRSAPQMRAHRLEYEGMGLGLFIAKTLLERSGAEIAFANGMDPFLSGAETGGRIGAIVEVVWPLRRILQGRSEALGDNPPLDA